jgi:hypothetical protein
MSDFLPSTKFINVIRTVTVSTTVEDSDQVLNCDTTLSAITINLKKIPDNYWSALYRLYIKDYGNNSATNNITIVAPTGFKINGLSSLTISANGASAVIQITTNTDYLCTVAYGTGSSTILTSSDTSTVQSVLTSFVGGYNVSANVKLKDYILAGLELSDPALNYYPKTPIYDAAGVILSTYFSDLVYAQTLGNQQAIKGYNSNQFSGAFTLANLNLVNGEITIPDNGIYMIALRIRIAIASSNTGSASTVSSNAATIGQPWNSDPSVKKTCLFKVGVYDYQYSGIGCEAEKTLTDCGNFEINTSMLRAYTAGAKLRVVFINNTDLDIYGENPNTSDVQFTAIKISEV